MKTTTIIIVVVALFAGLVAALMVRSLVSHPKDIVNNKIVVTARALPYGASINAQDLLEVPWSAPEFPEGAVKAIDEIIKQGDQARFALTNIPKSSPILLNQLTNPGQKPSLAAAIGEGKIAVTIRVDDVRGVAGFIMPGDHVDVALTRTDNNTHEGYVDTILQNMKVMAIDQISKERQDAAQVAKSVTLEATAIEAEKLRLASEVGIISLTLRNSANNSSMNIGRITTSDLSSADTNTKNNDTQNRLNSKNPGKISNIRIIKGGHISQMSVVNE